MRTVILILIIAVVALILAIASGFIDINQTRGVQAPELSADGNGVSAAGGQAPAFDVETGKVAIGAQDKNLTVKVPRLEIQRPAESNNSAAANSTN